MPNRSLQLFFAGLPRFILLIAVMTAFVPFSPKMPAAGLDPSWALGLNQAVALGFAFGKDIIFTLGPYSAIYTQAYHPATDMMMIVGSVYLALSYWFGLITFLKGSKLLWISAFALTLLGMIYARDSLLFSYPLLAGLISFQLIFARVVPSFNKQISLIALFAGFGLLCLIKGSLIILCSVVLVICFSGFFVFRQKKMSYLAIASALASLIYCWLAAGQSLSNLFIYFINSLGIAAGFTEAMSLDGNQTEIVVYLIA